MKFYLEADFVPWCEGHVSLHVRHGEREEETLAAIFVADSALSLLTTFGVNLDLSRHGTNYSFLAHDLREN